MSSDSARVAAATAAAELVEPGMTIGLGSGRAVWKVIELLPGRPVRAAFASDRTRELAVEAGIEEVRLDGRTRLDLAIDGADEIGPDLGLIKGGGAALLREKIVVEAAERFVVVAEAAKRVVRLGATRDLPVEVVRFGWRDTRRRLLDGLVPRADLRTGDREEPAVTDEGHHILDCEIPAGADPGVVEHGLFLGMADLALLGTADGGVERLERPS